MAKGQGPCAIVAIAAGAGRRCSFWFGL